MELSVCRIFPAGLASISGWGGIYIEFHSSFSRHGIAQAVLGSIWLIENVGNATSVTALRAGWLRLSDN